MLKRIRNKVINFIVIILGFFSTKSASKFLFRCLKKKKLDLKKPNGFNEKLMWLKIYNYNQNELVWNCSDKFLVRNYAIENGVDEKNLTKLIDVYDNVDDINFDKLPNQFVLKCTHGSGFNIICSNKRQLDVNETRKKLKKWLKKKFGANSAETHYNHVKPRIICEEFIKKDSYGNLPNDYKVYCFNGKAKIILVCSNRKNNYHDVAFYTINWDRINLRNDETSEEYSKPKSLDKMIDISEKLSYNFPFVRIDFYENKNECILGEMTFTPAACLADYTMEAEKKLGDMLKIK